MPGASPDMSAEGGVQTISVYPGYLGCSSSSSALSSAEPLPSGYGVEVESQNSLAEDGKLKVSREIEGGNREISEIDLPCVLSIQTGINEPRYVGMRGIRQVASVPIPTLGASDLGVEKAAVGEVAAKVRRVDYFVPAFSKGADMLHGSREENAHTVLELVAARGGLK